MARFRFSLFVAAPSHLVFGLWTDLDRWPEWIEGLTKITDVSGPLDQAGTSYVTWFGGMSGRHEVLEAERPRRIRTRLGSRLLRGVTEATFEPEDGGTRISQTFETEGLLPAIAARIFSIGSYRGSFRGELDTFKRIAELEAPTQEPRPG